MFNFVVAGGYKHARNNPRCKVAEDTKNGQVLVLDEANKLASFPTADEAKGGDLYVAFNIVDKPEIRNTIDFVIEKDEYVRAFRLADLADLLVEMNFQVLADNYASINVGDVLVAQAGTGKWVKADGETINSDEYAIKLEVTKKTGFGQQGIEAVVRA